MRLLVLFFLPLLGCVGGGPYNILIDSEFSEKEVEVIRQSFMEWHLATGSEDARVFYQSGYEIGHPFNKKDWVDADEHTPIFHRVNKSDPGFAYLKEVWGNYSGDSSFTGFARHGDIIGTLHEPYMGEGFFKREAFHALVLHEVSHFIGLDHEEFSLSRTDEGAACLTDFTVDEFCSIYGSCSKYARGMCGE